MILTTRKCDYKIMSEDNLMQWRPKRDFGEDKEIWWGTCVFGLGRDGHLWYKIIFSLVDFCPTYIICVALRVYFIHLIFELAVILGVGFVKMKNSY